MSFFSRFRRKSKAELELESLLASANFAYVAEQLRQTFGGGILKKEFVAVLDRFLERQDVESAKQLLIYEPKLVPLFATSKAAADLDAAFGKRPLDTSARASGGALLCGRCDTELRVDPVVFDALVAGKEKDPSSKPLSIACKICGEKSALREEAIRAATPSNLRPRVLASSSLVAYYCVDLPDPRIEGSLAIGFRIRARRDRSDGLWQGILDETSTDFPGMEAGAHVLGEDMNGRHIIVGVGRLCMRPRASGPPPYQGQAIYLNVNGVQGFANPKCRNPSCGSHFDIVYSEWKRQVDTAHGRAAGSGNEPVTVLKCRRCGIGTVISATSFPPRFRI